MTKTQLIKWMQTYHHTVEWVADKCEVATKTVRSWRSDRPVPKHAVIKIKALMEADKAKAEASSTEKHTLKLEFTDEEFNKVCDAALKENMRPHDWAIERLNSLSLEQMAEALNVTIPPIAAYDPTVDQPIAAEDEEAYGSNVIDPHEREQNANGGDVNMEKGSA